MITRGTSVNWTKRLAVASGLAVAALAVAQPAEFLDLDVVTIPATPAYAQDSLDTSAWIEFGGFQQPGETITVKWARLELSAPLSSDEYLDFTSFVSDPATPIVLALYDAAGSLVAFDATQGTSQGAAGLSFGSVVERVPTVNDELLGQDGSLGAGVYWLALVAGPLSSVSLGATNWDVSTTASIIAGFGTGETYVEVTPYVGNTTPVPPPANNDCANAIVVGEDIGATPAWTGTSFGATQDGLSPCYSTSSNVTFKDVWLSYVPSASGWVNVAASNVGQGGNSPIVSRYDLGCGNGPTRCSGGGFFVSVGGTRMAFEVTQGQPVLLGIAQRGGFWGEMRVNIDFVPPPCNLQTPPGAIPEDETCGELSNEGCSALPNLFSPIAPGQSVSGQLFTTTTSRDRDWYLFTLTEPAIVQLSARSQMSAELVLFGEEFEPGSCFGPQLLLRRTPDVLAPCGVMSGQAPVPPGTYKIGIAHLYQDGFGCGSGYNDYWISLSTLPCDQPALLAEPNDAGVCLGASVTYSANFGSPEPITYQWQVGIAYPENPPGVLSWVDIFDGEFFDAFSQAQFAGTDTDTLTVSNVDAAAGIARAFRCIATTCTVRSTREAAFILVPPQQCGPICDPLDFNNDGIEQDPTDIEAFLSVYSGGPCVPSAATCNDIDFNNDGIEQDPTDIESFLSVYSGGPCL